MLPSVGLQAVVLGEFAVDMKHILVGLYKASGRSLEDHFKKAGPQASNAEFVEWHIISILIAPWPPLKEAL